MAFVRAYQPYHQLVLLWRVGILASPECSLLQVVWSRVRVFFNICQLIKTLICSVIGRYTSLGSTYNTVPNPALLITPPPIPETPLRPSFITTPSTTVSHSDIHVIPSSPEVDALTPIPILSASPIQSSIESQLLAPPPGVDVPRGDAETINVPRYKPAYELQDASLERSGRGIVQPIKI